MKGKPEVVRGSGNVFRDLDREKADIEQLKALLAAEIIKMLDRDELTVRAAQARTGFAAADFSRIRNADLGRFTADRLMSILNGLGSRVEVKVRVRPLEPLEPVRSARPAVACYNPRVPKLKTHKGASKRFKKTGTGKIVRNHAFGRHILTSKPHKRKKKLHQSVVADAADQPVLKRMLPY